VIGSGSDHALSIRREIDRFQPGLVRDRKAQAEEPRARDEIVAQPMKVPVLGDQDREDCLLASVLLAFLPFFLCLSGLQNVPIGRHVDGHLRTLGVGALQLIDLLPLHLH